MFDKILFIALRQAGIPADVGNEFGSVYLRNPNTGKLNGVLLENAGIIMMDKAMNATRHPEIVGLTAEGIKNALYVMAENGITSAQDAR